MDAENYAQSWEQASPALKSKITKHQWVDKARQAHDHLGKLESRGTPTVRYFRKNPPNWTPGEYEPVVAAQVLYDSKFADLSSAKEICALILEKNGQWRVAGYFVRPK